jgi:hypothetical protein
MDIEAILEKRQKYVWGQVNCYQRCISIAAVMEKR